MPRATPAGGGYIVRAVDTRAYEGRAEAEWWPDLRRLYRDPTGWPPADWSADQRLSWAIHHPVRAPKALVEAWPAHLHINLLPRLQGQGLGSGLIQAWLAAARCAGARGAHLGVSAANARAIGFYRAIGFAEPSLPRPPPAGVLWFAKSI